MTTLMAFSVNLSNMALVTSFPARPLAGWLAVLPTARVVPKKLLLDLAAPWLRPTLAFIEVVVLARLAGALLLALVAQAEVVATLFPAPKRACPLVSCAFMLAHVSVCVASLARSSLAQFP